MGQMSFGLGTCPAAHTSVTLTYFDKENSSTACSPCLVNRLDLTVEKDGVTSYPNGRTGADEKNNSQRVRLPHVAGDVLTVKVRAVNLATAYRKFALVVSGCIESQHDTLLACKEEGTDKNEKRLALNKNENRARKKLCPKTPAMERKSCMKKSRDEFREQNKVAKKVLK